MKKNSSNSAYSTFRDCLNCIPAWEGERDQLMQQTLIFLKTLRLLGSVTMLYMASGGSPTSTVIFRLQREPSGTLIYTNFIH